MNLVTDNISRELNGKLWACLIAPRPLALISTRDADGVPNIAPYSSYAGLATHPPLLGVSFSRREGGDKHTLANIKATGVFVINLVPRFLAEEMNRAAGGTDKADDFARLGLTQVPAETIDCPRIGESPAALECRLVNTVPLPPSRCELVVGQIVGVFLRDEYVKHDGTFDPLAADLLASVGAEEYLSLNGESLSLPKTWG